MKRNTLWSLTSAAVMVGLPALAKAFAPADTGFAIVLLLFYAINPVYSILAGACAGRDGKEAWFRPLMAALLFPIGTGISFTWEEPAFWGYAAVYLALGYAAYGIAFLVIQHRKER